MLARYCFGDVKTDVITVKCYIMLKLLSINCQKMRLV